MGRSDKQSVSTVVDAQKPAIRFLVESALRQVASDRRIASAQGREDWIAHLVEVLLAETDAPLRSLLSSLRESGVSHDKIYQSYVPDAARYLGELWVSDKASFVDVTIGAGRLQALFRGRDNQVPAAPVGHSIPLGHSVLMIVPEFEDHSLGAFVAADALRRHGLGVHMGIGLNADELVALIASNRFSMIGITLGTPITVEKAKGLISTLRQAVDYLPPLVIGGHAVDLVPDAARSCGADHMARSAEEALSLCGLPSVIQASDFKSFGAAADQPSSERLT